MILCKQKAIIFKQFCSEYSKHRIEATGRIRDVFKSQQVRLRGSIGGGDGWMFFPRGDLGMCMGGGMESRAWFSFDLVLMIGSAIKTYHTVRGN